MGRWSLGLSICVTLTVLLWLMRPTPWLGRIDFYAWLQWIVDEQLQRAQAEAKASGMSLGIMHDLAVGINPHGADVWTPRRYLLLA